MSNKKIDIPVADKYVLTIDEAAALFNIGTNKLYTMIQQDPRADWVLHCGSWYRIKKKQFAAMIDNTDTL